MSLKKILASEHLIPSPQRVATGPIPKRVADAADDFMMVLRNAGVHGSAKAFNSGYFGVVIDAGMAGKLLYLDQPGVVGLDHQSEGYVAFGKYPMPDPRRGLVYRVHNAKSFGDADLTRAEWEDAWRDVQWALEGLLEKAGYTVRY